jgi:hypothetical protein
MTIRYFVETNRNHKYLAFDAPEGILDRIEGTLNHKNFLVRNGQINYSKRPACNGQRYEYFTRLRNMVNDGQIEKIFHNLERPSMIGETFSRLFIKLSDIKLEIQLIRLALEIREKYPVTRDEDKKNFILSEEMISLFLSKKPTSIDEFTSRIPPEPRSQIAPIGGLSQPTKEYLKRIFSIIHEHEGSISERVSTH